MKWIRSDNPHRPEKLTPDEENEVTTPDKDHLTDQPASDDLWQTGERPSNEDRSPEGSERKR